MSVNVGTIDQYVRIVAGLALVAGIYWIGRRAFDIQTGFTAGLIAVTTAGVFSLARSPVPDMTLSCAVVTAMGAFVVAEFGLGVEEHGLIDQVLLEEGTVQVGAALEQEAEDVALGEGGEDGGEAEASGVVGDVMDFYAEQAESGSFGWRSEGAA